MLEVDFKGVGMDASWMLSRSLRVSLAAVLGAAGSVHALDEQTRTQQRPLDLALPRSFDMPADVRMRNVEQERLRLGAQRQMQHLRMRKPYGAGYEMRISAASVAPARAPATWAGAAPEACATGAHSPAAASGHGGGRGGR
jgi:hypothetical protein